MAEGLQRMRFHSSTDAPVAEPGPVMRGAAPPDQAEAGVAFQDDETAARYYLDRLMAADARPQVRGLRSAGAARRAPDLTMTGELRTPLDTRLVGFTQTHATVPVFGSKAVVEMTGDRQLVAASANLGPVEGVNPNASLSPAEAIDRVASITERGGEPASVPQLQLFRHPGATPPDDNWHLVWHVPGFPAAPVGEILEEGHGLAPSMRSAEPHYDYVVDAHTGELLYHYSSAPTAAAPVRLSGLDELDAVQQFWGSQVDGAFALTDPLFDLITFDLGLGGVDMDALPQSPVTSDGADLQAEHRAAVMAHVNGRRVKEFYNSVLGRNGIDGKGMDLVSVVNCTYDTPGHAHSDEWPNAVWWEDRMWYGQVREGGRLVSLARHLDIIAHELTHGVTETTSGLVYRDQSGALNESFSDIFGVLVKNYWLAPDRDDVGTWNWEIGSGWRNGGPLRDLSDPTRTGDPSHMRDYDPDLANRDHGGVHTNSNIHNKAAHGVLTATRGGGRAFSVEESAVLFYMTLLRLGPLATFLECRDAAVDSALSMFAGDDPQGRAGVVHDAYAAVGIE